MLHIQGRLQIKINTYELNQLSSSSKWRFTEVCDIVEEDSP